ncbi:hypothetical protein KY290_034830 [Solanum tuberosum]|uniref:Tf2-1-like SH3-like domain-containing protein n=1 Tax=Solanum tuberosum TaxID=4113 RepID=A0ABQ7U4B9_SOLTU|nr:hypothetical protein KY289_034206 [Solanum tuberosum]KAH0646020.1 hypothetical protein KY284_033904 [Solanum tuberosum]KAH0741787.1 hypothetical protein KY290_034830 [Solanum tuberosum]
MVRTDQKALKHLLNQHIHTYFQVAAISKLMAFDFSIEYKKGSENKVVDALSRKPDAELLAISLLTLNDMLYQQIKDTWIQNATLQELIVKLQVQPFKYFTWCNDQLRWKGRLVVGHDTQLRNTIITLWHSTPQVSLKLRANDVILVAVDRLSKCGHFMSLQHPYTTQDVAYYYLDHVFKLHEWWYNITYHTAIRCTPFKVLYGKKPSIHLSYLVGEAANEMVDRSLEARKAIIELLKLHINRVQQRMKDLANKHRSDRVFAVGDWVYLKLQPYRQVSVAAQPFNKLAAKYYILYIIDAYVGAVAYKLLLHVDVLIHLIFHVSQLKRCHEVPRDISHPPVLQLSNPYCPMPKVILERRLVKKGNKVVCQVFVQWLGLEADQITWEYLSELQHKFPSFQP